MALGRRLRGIELVAAILVSRLAVLLAAWVTESSGIVNRSLTSGDSAPILRSLTSWDGWWYLGIARTGYHVEALVGPYHDYAFLPGFPLVVRALTAVLPVGEGLVAILVANVAFIAALYLLALLGDRVVGRDRARTGAAILAISPFSAVFSMAYSESLFLLLVVGAFLAAERDRRAVAGILIGLAALTRLQGVAFAVPLAFLFFLRDSRRLRPSQGWPGLAAIATGGYLTWVGAFAGASDAYGSAQEAWGRSVLGTGLIDGNLASVFSPYHLVLLAILLTGVFLLVYLRPDRIPLPYAVLPPLQIAIILASGSLQSAGRLLTLAFPYAWVVAGRSGAGVRRLFVLASLAGLFGVSVAQFAGRLVP